MINTLIHQEYGSDANPEEVTYKLLLNSTIKLEQALTRKNVSDLEKWVRVGQMDLFGSGEFKVPQILLPKSIAEVLDFMLNKSIEEQAQADELARQFRKQQQKANEVELWAMELSKLKQGVMQRGMNPDEVSVEQAIQTAAAVQQFAEA